MDTREGRNKKTLWVISDDPAFHREVAETIQDCELQNKVTLLSASYEESAQHAAALVLIDLSEGEPARVEFARNYCTAAADSGTKVICAGSNLNVDHILYLLKIGVHHFLKTPLESHEFKSLFFSLLTAPPPSLEPEDPTKPRNGKIVTVYSPKGGSGVTLLAINLAITLFKKDPKSHVAICDLAPQAGDVLTYLNLNAQYALRDLIDNAGRLDSSLLEGVMTPHEESGIQVLAAPSLDQEALSTNCIEEWRLILTLLKQHQDFIVIDSAHTDENLLQSTLGVSDAIVLIGNLDVPSLKGILFGLTKLNRMHIDPHKIKIIINRFNAKNQLNIKEFFRNAKHPVDSKLPNDYSVCVESINTGKPISLYYAHSEIAKTIKELADQIYLELGGTPSFRNPLAAPERAPVAEAPRKGLWRLL